MAHSSDSKFDHIAAFNPNSISLLNWNIYKGQRANWAFDLKQFSHRHDLVTIQEAYLGDELKELLNRNNLHWAMNTAFHLRRRASGVMTASSVKAISTSGLHQKEPLIRLPKATLISHYPVEGMRDNLLVANIHGINFSLGTLAYRRQLNALYQEIRHHQGPVIVAGDFNSWSKARMQIVDELVASLKLGSVDWDGFHHATRLFGNTIDHVFYRGLRPLNQESWRVSSSDHNPIRITFKVR
ncbi:MAG: endonuclease/exonuclease/phosphatase family protein [Gammaproteobacteria bacterium]|nr:endonuclease/exonuclease/phosphatase family protein [Gammaproteobacteria bacterium]